MSKNTKQSSPTMATVAAKTLKKPSASQIQRRLAASVLAQAGTGNQTGSEMESVAARALQNPNSADLTQKLAASVLAQANKER